MIKSYCAAIFASLFTVGCASQTTIDVCNLLEPPFNAAVRSTHAGKLFTYPESISKDYTGCRVIWLENGERLATVRFASGVVLSVNIKEPDGGIKECGYTKEGNLTQGDHSMCLPREIWAR